MSQSKTRSITTNGQLTIPKSLREKYGEDYKVVDDEGGIRLVPLKPAE